MLAFWDFTEPHEMEIHSDMGITPDGLSFEIRNIDQNEENNRKSLDVMITYPTKA